ncbi:MAG: hypothetical protein IPO92_10640 [Saprospiraceae bacterium]|nr:hypothetical protein [Saprospiraceae bacterium]
MITAIVHPVSMMQSMKNCFNGTDSWDIEVTESSSIHETQGIADDAAGNCFSKKVATGSTSDHFDYYVLQNTIPQSCKKPGDAGNFTERQATQDISNPCGTGGINIYGSLLPRYRDCMITNAADFKPMITLLRAEIIALENNTTLSPWIKRWLIAKYKRCLDKVIKQKSKDDRDQKGKDSTVVFLTAQPEFRYQAAAYGILMDHNETAKARTILNSLSAKDAGETDFVDVQNIFFRLFIR